MKRLYDENDKLTREGNASLSKYFDNMLEIHESLTKEGYGLLDALAILHMVANDVDEYARYRKETDKK